MTSASVFHGREGCVASTFGAVPISTTGSRSFTVSNDRFCRNGLTAWVSNTNSQVLPSGADFATDAVPALPDPPDLFSMTMVAPRRCCSPFCTRRAIGSTVPPGGNGTTILTMPDGQFCARAIRLRPNNGASAAPAIIDRRVIGMKSSLSVQPFFGGNRPQPQVNHTARRQYRWLGESQKLV